MYCKHCGNKIADDSKFCQYCGGKIDNVASDESVEEITEVVTPVEETNDDVVTSVEVEETTEDAVEAVEIVDETETKEWYYVESNESKGGFTESEMKSFITSGTLNASSLVWKTGMSDWVKLSETELYEKETDDSSDSIWYYVENNDTKGPFTEEEMKTFIDDGTINGNSYVWKAGMEDWKKLKDTELAGNESSEVKSEPVFTKNVSYSAPMITKRSIGLAIVLTICTCGLYAFYWIYCIATDINKIAQSQGKEKGPDGGIVVLLSIVTCSLYLLYYYYKAEKVLSECTYPNGTHPNDEGIICIVLGVIGLDIISYSIIQSAINEFAENN